MSTHRAIDYNARGWWDSPTTRAELVAFLEGHRGTACFAGESTQLLREAVAEDWHAYLEEQGLATFSRVQLLLRVPAHPKRVSVEKLAELLGATNRMVERALCAVPPGIIHKDGRELWSRTGRNHG